MPTTAPPPTMHRTSPDITATKRIFYNALWQKARLEDPDRFNTWPLVSELLPSSPARLEIGPGLRFGPAGCRSAGLQACRVGQT